jgi:hypothetical protein
MQQEKIRNLCFGTLTTKKSLFIYYLISSVATGLFTVFSFIVLGIFYKANNNTILVNLLVWLSTILITYLVLFICYFLIAKLIRPCHQKTGPLVNGYAIGAGYLTILIVCLANSYNINDYSFVEVTISMSGVFAIIQVIFDISNSKKKKKLNENK